MAGGKVKAASAKKPRAASKARTSVKAPVKSSAKPKAVAKAKAPPKKNQPQKNQSKKTQPKKTPAKAKRPVKAVDKVVAVARTVTKAKAAQASSGDAKIIKELGDLAKYIRAAKREIAAIRPDDVKDEHLPKAADELDAVVEATADATNTIMDACEVVEGVMGEVSGEVSNKLMDATTRIYEACTFQDITGQRIGKVVTTMKHIEECIDALIDAFGPKKARAKSGAKKKAPPNKASASQQSGQKKVTDAELLEGPQLGDSAKSQAEIDDLFASFD